MHTRLATNADLDCLTATLTAAFRVDPIWGWAFPNPEDLAVWWRFFITSALRYPCIWVVGDCAIACRSGFPQMAPSSPRKRRSGWGPLLDRLIGPRAPDVGEVLERFEASHPRDRPHYYLSLLGPIPTIAGAGWGWALWPNDLRVRILEGMPTYLESTNPENNHRYERLGFQADRCVHDSGRDTDGDHDVARRGETVQPAGLRSR